MTAATRLLASSGGCVASLNYDDLTMVASGVTIDNTNGNEKIAFFIIINDQTLSATVNVGQVSAITFPLLMAVTTPLAVNGVTGVAIAGYSSHGIGSA